MKVKIILISLALISLPFGRVKDNDVVVVRDKDKSMGHMKLSVTFRYPVFNILAGIK